MIPVLKLIFFSLLIVDVVLSCQVLRLCRSTREVNVTPLPEIDLNVHRHAKCTGSVCKIEEDSLRFFVIGDWGGIAVWPYVTQITKKCAKAMAQMGDDKKTHFQISLGDNFYMVGVQSLNDSLFRTKFENVFKGDSMKNPWYVIAGNHDNYGDLNAQIAYTTVSDRWVFPYYNYSIQYEIANGVTIDMFVLDTIMLCGNTREAKYPNFYTYLTAPSSDRNTQGATDPEAAERQWVWLEDQLSNSVATYIFVIGHYPLYSVAEHGPTPCMVKRLRPMLHKYKVNAYFAGHDHDLQHLRDTYDDGWTVDHVLSGAGSFEIKSRKNKDKVPSHCKSEFMYPLKQWSVMAGKAGIGKGGFVYAEVGEKEAAFRFMISNMTEAHSFTLKPRPVAADQNVPEIGR